MSSFAATTDGTNAKDNDVKKKWAAESDSESSGEEDANEPEENIAEVSGSDSESESEDEKLNASLLVAATKTEIKVANKPLTKKEKKALREKELEDLDSILNQFSDGVKIEAAPAADVPVAAADSTEANKKKKPKKKTATKKESEKPAAVEGDTPIQVVADVSAILKNKAKKSGSGSGKSSISDAQRAAMSEAALKKDSGSSKKKKDTSKFSEYSY